MTKNSIFLSITVFLLTGCSIFDESDPKLRMGVFDEPPGAECQLGGIRIGAGKDKNENGKLDVNEITSSTVICHVKNGEGQLSLLATNKLLASKQFPAGGFHVVQGFDFNKNNVFGDYPDDEFYWGYEVLHDAMLGVFIRSRIFYIGAIENPSSGVISDQHVVTGFNIDDYTEYDEAVFAGEVATSEYQDPIQISLQLYNKTDNEPIAGGVYERTIELGAGSYENDSDNCITGFPHKSIDIGLRFTFSPENAQISRIAGRLKLIRNTN